MAAKQRGRKKQRFYVTKTQANKIARLYTPKSRRGRPRKKR